MITKIKIIAAAVIILATIVSIICIYVYINNLNSKITDLNVTIAEQNNEIQALGCQIDVLEKNVESFRETINITNDYINNIERIREDESTIKQEIYQEVINDEEAKNWFEETIPNSLVDVLLRHADDELCY